MKVENPAAPIRELSLTYVLPCRGKGVLGGPFGTFDIGWLWLYIAVYLPLVMIVRIALKVA